MEERFELIATENGLKILCWRTVPKNSSVIGEMARSQEPFLRQVFVQPKEPESCDSDEFRRKLFVLRKESTHRLVNEGFRYYICSVSPTIVVYKVSWQ